MHCHGDTKYDDNLNTYTHTHNDNAMHDPSTRPQTAFLEATWETFGCHLGGIWELEAEEAFSSRPNYMDQIHRRSSTTKHLHAHKLHVSAWTTWSRSIGNVYTDNKQNNHRYVYRSLSAFNQDKEWRLEQWWFSDENWRCSSMMTIMSRRTLFQS